MTIMHLIASVLLLFFILELSNSQVVELNKNPSVGPSADPRFFNLGGIIGQLFPGFNQGHQGGSGSNPGGMGFPANSQFYPNGVIQSQTTPIPDAQQTHLPPIDDASIYPIKGHMNPQLQNPNQGNFGTRPYPNQGNFGGSQNPQQNTGGQQQLSYPNQGIFGGTQQTQYPNQGNFGGSQQMQYPNQGNSGVLQQNLYPNQGNFGGSQQYPSYQNPNQGIYGGSQQMPYTNQGNFGGPQQMYPNQGIFSGTQQTPYPDQGNFGYPQRTDYPYGNNNMGNENNFHPGDGTLDGIVPPQESTYPNDQNNFMPGQNNNVNTYGRADMPNQMPPQNDGTVAILGNPVIVPPMTTPSPDQIFFPSR